MGLHCPEENASQEDDHSDKYEGALSQILLEGWVQKLEEKDQQGDWLIAMES